MPLPLSHITPISGKPPTYTDQNCQGQTKGTESRQNLFIIQKNADHKFQVGKGSKASSSEKVKPNLHTFISAELVPPAEGAQNTHQKRNQLLP
jgi:hypothetical protein